MGFELSDNVSVQQDAEGMVCQLNHTQQPYMISDAVGAEEGDADNALSLEVVESIGVREIAERYMRDALPHFGLNTNLMSLEAAERAPTEQLQFQEEKSVMGNATVSYGQTYRGIPVWDSGFVVQIEEQPLQVIGSQSTLIRDLQVEMPPEDVEHQTDQIDNDTLANVLGVNTATIGSISYKRTYIYQFVESERVQLPHSPERKGVKSFYLLSRTSIECK